MNSNKEVARQRARRALKKAMEAVLGEGTISEHDLDIMEAIANASLINVPPKEGWEVAIRVGDVEGEGEGEGKDALYPTTLTGKNIRLAELIGRLDEGHSLRLGKDGEVIVTFTHQQIERGEDEEFLVSLVKALTPSMIGLIIRGKGVDL